MTAIICLAVGAAAGLLAGWALCNKFGAKAKALEAAAVGVIRQGSSSGR